MVGRVVDDGSRYRQLGPHFPWSPLPEAFHLRTCFWQPLPVGFCKTRFGAMACRPPGRTCHTGKSPAHTRLPSDGTSSRLHRQLRHGATTIPCARVALFNSLPHVWPPQTRPRLLRSLISQPAFLLPVSGLFCAQPHLSMDLSRAGDVVVSMISVLSSKNWKGGGPAPPRTVEAQKGCTNEASHAPPSFRSLHASLPNSSQWREG